MAVSILEALENAKYNYETAIINQLLRPAVLSIAREQFKNAITLLEKGYPYDEEVEPLLEKYGAIENVPDWEQPEE